MVISASIPSKEEGQAPLMEASAEVNFGANLAEAVELFGEELVLKGWIASATIDAQARMRRAGAAAIKAGKTAAEAAEAAIASIAGWKPGIKAPRTSGKKKAAKNMLALFETLRGKSPEEVAAYLQQLEAELGAQS